MKRINLTLTVILFAAVISLAACSAKPSLQTNSTLDEVEATQAKSSTSTCAAVEATVDNTESVSITDASDNDSSVEYTRDDNELEILGPNTSDDSGNNNDSTDSVDNTEPKTEKPAEAETEPTNPFAQGEPIELPFVPVE